ncbi:MAG: sulfotransferase [Verrucomicrobia bacterium]|nr:sulfotransferase [Verrucomicrobiota bacterium]MCH8511990.1 sulfotransferase [Kiritimatiellia bacterium]
MSSDEAIQAEGLSKSYAVYEKPRDRMKQMFLGWRRQYHRDFRALRNVSFQIHRGETMGIVGCNGSGKSTLLQLVAGILVPSQGMVDVQGRVASLLELGAGFNPDYTGRENVWINGAILGLTPKEIASRYDAIVDFAGIGAFVDQPVTTYSSGMMLRLAFAVAIHVEPDILLIDEALAVGDELFQQKCFARIRALRASGTTIVFVSHAATQIIELCDRAMLLDRGELLATGHPRDILGHYRRMIFAPPDKREQVRQSIPIAMANAPSHVPQQAALGTERVEDAFESELKPQEPMEYESRGARIGEMVLINSEGRQVNALQRGLRYHCQYDVTFDRPAFHVRFGTAFRNKTGIQYAGSFSAMSSEQCIQQVQPGTRVRVQFAFDCRLNPGVYFMNAGVYGRVDKDETLMHRKVDTFVFRVQPVMGNIETGEIFFNLQPNVRILPDDETPPDTPKSTCSILAILAVRNVAKTLGRVLQHYAENNIDVHVIDHSSTDETAQIVESHGPSTVIGYEKHPFDGYFRWGDMLKRKDQVFAESTHDWVLHADGDEILESPVSGESLREMIERLHQTDAEVIDADEFVFVPTSDDEDYSGSDFVSEMKLYYHFAPPGRTLHRCVRKSAATAAWFATGGHGATVNADRIPKEKIRLQHYVGLSLDDLRRQYLGRVFRGPELQKGWHLNRVATSPGFIVPPDPDQMLDLSIEGWRADLPLSHHLFFSAGPDYQAPEILSPKDTGHAPMPFIVGVGRSGTTLLRLMLDAHPDMVMTPETHWLPDVLALFKEDPSDVERLESLVRGNPKWTDMGLPDEAWEKVIRRHDPEKPDETIRRIYRAYADKHGSPRVGDKTPLHNRSMHAIASMLPEAHFIHILRDGRDVAVSHRDLWFGPGKDVRAAASSWVWNIREARQQAEFVPHYLEIRFEDLIANPEEVLRRVGDFIDLPFDPVQLDYHRYAEARLQELGDQQEGDSLVTAEQRKAIFERTKHPPDPSRIGRWRKEMNEEDVRLFENIAGDLLKDLNYPESVRSLL